MPPTTDYPVTREQARVLDRIAIEDYGIDGLILMENAGRACALEAASMLKWREDGQAALLCGPGNNGGDGFVVARHLVNWGYGVRAWLVGDLQEALRKGGEAGLNLQIALNMNIEVEEIRDGGDLQAALEGTREADLAVDALLGTGISGQVRGSFRPLIEGLNQASTPVLAVDVPSGLDCDTGRPMGVAVEAERTVTFVLNKRGFTRSGARSFTGEVQVAEISVPRRAILSKVKQWRAREEQSP